MGSTATPLVEEKLLFLCCSHVNLKNLFMTAAIIAPLPPQVVSSIEWQQRMLSGRSSRQLPLFEKPRRAVLVVDVARAWSGKPQMITSISPT